MYVKLYMQKNLSKAK